MVDKRDLINDDESREAGEEAITNNWVVPDYSSFGVHATKELDKIKVSKGFTANLSTEATSTLTKHVPPVSKLESTSVSSR